MALHPSTLAALLLAGHLLPGTALAQERPAGPPSGDEARDLFAWFDGRGYPDFRGRAWGRITYTCGDGPFRALPREQEMRGFLLEEGKDSVRMLFPCLVEMEFLKEAAAAADPRKARFVKFVEEDLLECGKALVLAREGLPPPGARADSPDLPEGFAFMGYPYRVSFFTLARALDAAGEREWGLRLLACYDRERWSGLDEQGLATRRLLEEDLGDGLLQGEVSGFGVAGFPWEAGDTPTPRADLLATCRRIVEKLPGSSAAVKARRMAPILERMIAEDAAHRVPAGFPESCSAEDRVREWIFRLREQGGSCFCLTHGPPRVLVGEGTPAHRLADLGLEAVPGLLGAVKDDGLTRAVDNDGGFIGSDLLPVGGAVLQVLEAISGRPFSDGDEAAAWWTEVGAVGYERVLVEGVRRGDLSSAGQAELLVRHFPGRALEPVVEAARRIDHEWSRGPLVDVAACIPGDGPVPFLLEEMEKGPFLDGRVAAARGLQARGRPEALAAMIREWRGSAGPRSPRGLLAFLLGTGDPAAVRALAEGLAARPAEWRQETAMEAWTSVEAPGDGKAASREFREAAEDLLAGLLGDRVALSGNSHVLGVDFEGMRIGDLAGTGLARLRGTPGALDLEAAPAERDGMLRSLGNAWRRDRGLEPPPEPPK